MVRTKVQLLVLLSRHRGNNDRLVLPGKTGREPNNDLLMIAVIFVQCYRLYYLNWHGVQKYRINQNVSLLVTR